MKNNGLDLIRLPESKSDPCVSDDGRECFCLNIDKSCVELRTTCIKEKIVYVKE
jgi:hypothetical protein